MERLGKSEARARFLRLVERVASGEGAVEITDRGEIAAVLIGYREYQYSQPASLPRHTLPGFGLARGRGHLDVHGGPSRRSLTPCQLLEPGLDARVCPRQVIHAFRRVPAWLSRISAAMWSVSINGFATF
ncbi:MAG: type II toxin-antitoxin system Phd/YefM family antitoxin [Armatimonadetes bacterium]|nr:type II toxin-antitoxin system Phd/YefM family antitoxin [Armatimonadota bacterium]